MSIYNVSSQALRKLHFWQRIIKDVLAAKSWPLWLQSSYHVYKNWFFLKTSMLIWASVCGVTWRMGTIFFERIFSRLKTALAAVFCVFMGLNGSKLPQPRFRDSALQQQSQKYLPVLILQVNLSLFSERNCKQINVTSIEFQTAFLSLFYLCLEQAELILCVHNNFIR